MQTNYEETHINPSNPSMIWPSGTPFPALYSSFKPRHEWDMDSHYACKNLWKIAPPKYAIVVILQRLRLALVL